MNISDFKTALAILFFVQISSGFCIGQQKYEYYTSKNLDNSKRQFVNLEQFRVGAPATDQSRTTRRVAGPSIQEQISETAPGTPATNQPRKPGMARIPRASVAPSIVPGIRPQLLGRAVTRNQFNYNFINQAQFSAGPDLGVVETVTWRSPNFTHKTLYFEEMNLERYGISKGNLQPFYSAYHFFGSVAAIPYSLATRSPNCCTSTIGHCRPGNCCPATKQRLLPLDRKGAATQVLVLGAILAAM